MDESSDEIPSPFQRLLPDCHNAILQYLTIQECLRYGTTSKTGLVGILSDLHRRRKEQFLVRHMYQLRHPFVLKVVTTDDERNVDSSNRGSAFCQPPEEHHWHVLQSAAERIQCLYRSLPSSHPYDKDVRELLLDLNQASFNVTITKANSSNDIADASSMVSTNGTNFEFLCRQLRRLTKAHRLHARLLSQCTIQCEPRPCDPALLYTTLRVGTSRRDISSAFINDNARFSTTVFLGHYVGDVLLAYYLLGHSIAGLVEGGSTHTDWTGLLAKSLQQHIFNDSCDNSINAKDWYQLWIYLHSSLLRVLPFTHSQQDVLGLCLNMQVSTTPNSEREQHNIAYPPDPYFRTIKTAVDELSGVLDHLTESTATAPFGVHRTTYNHFGPLGPTFRGRDRIQSTLMRPGTLISLLKEQVEVFGSFPLHSWLARHDEAMQWLIQLTQECKKSRPMTVTPPLVTIELMSGDL